MTDKNASGSETSTKNKFGSCKIESVVTVDDRGQMVLPKEIRDKAKIRAGDKLAVVSWENNEEICCLSLIKTEDLENLVKELLGSAMKEMLQ